MASVESGLHYNWHRHSDPTTVRHLQPDPLGMPDGPSRWPMCATPSDAALPEPGRNGGGRIPIPRP